MNIDAWLSTGRQALEPAEDARRAAEILLCHALGVGLPYLYAHPGQAVPPEPGQRFTRLIRRRQGGEPIAYLVGRKAFWTLQLRVTPAVLIPRPETELLVEQALQLLPAALPARVADLGTGSGAIALALACERPHWAIVATDISAAALQVAEQNARDHQLLSVEFRRGSWTTPLDGGFDLIVSNPPYVASDDPHLAQGDCRFEPRTALSPGMDGLEHLRRISREALPALNPGGWLLLEHGYDQGPALTALLGAAGFCDVASIRDLAGHARVALARKLSS